MIFKNQYAITRLAFVIIQSYRSILLLDKLLPTDKESFIIKLLYTHTYKLEIKRSSNMIEDFLC